MTCRRPIFFKKNGPSESDRDGGAGSAWTGAGSSSSLQLHQSELIQLMTDGDSSGGESGLSGSFREKLQTSFKSSFSQPREADRPVGAVRGAQRDKKVQPKLHLRRSLAADRLLRAADGCFVFSTFHFFQRRGTIGVSARRSPTCTTRTQTTAGEQSWLARLKPLKREGKKKREQQGARSSENFLQVPLLTSKD